MPLEITERSYTCLDSERQEIHKALINEFDTVTRSQNIHRIKLYSGILHQTFPDKFLYIFESPKEADKSVEADKPHILIIDGKTVAGNIFSVTEKKIEIELEKDFGKIIPLIEVIIDLRLLIDLVDRKIVKIDRDPNKFQCNTLGNIFHPSLTTNADALNQNLNHEARRGDEIVLNHDQKNAVHDCLSNNFRIIIGPPGTGKTKTLEAIIAELLSHNLKVLFASNTNNAIDALLKDIISETKCPYKIYENLIFNSKIIRIGSQTDYSVKQVLSPRALIERKSSKIIEEIKTLERNLSDSQTKVDQLRKELTDFNYAKKIKDESQTIKINLEKTRSPEFLQNELKTVLKKSKLLKQIVLELKNQFSHSLENLKELSISISEIKNKMVGINAKVISKDQQLKSKRIEIEQAEQKFDSLNSNIFKKIINKDRIERVGTLIKLLKEEFDTINFELKSYRSTQEKLLDNEIQMSGKFIKIYDELLSNTFLDETDPSQIEEIIKGITYKSFKENELSLIIQIASDLNKGSSLYKIKLLLRLYVIDVSSVDKFMESRRIHLNTEIINNINIIEKSNFRLVQIKNELEKYIILFDRPIEYWTVLDQKINLIITNEITPLKKEIGSLNEKLKIIEKEILHDSQFVCCTLVKASYDTRLEECNFDVLIVDELSMVSLPQLYCTASLIKKRVVLCGDSLQLRPIAQSESELSIKWLRSSYFDFTGQTYRDHSSDLTIQRRMPNRISNIVKPWYQKYAKIKLNDHYLINHELSLINLKLHNSIFNNGELFFIDTSSLGTYHSKSSDGSPYNLINAAIIAELVRELIIDFEIDPKNINCITPYRAQYKLTYSLIKHFLNHEIEVNPSISANVHKIQGSEAPIIFYDFTDGKQSYSTFFVRTPELNIHNVAITRSKLKLIFIGDLEKLKKMRNSVYKERPAILEILDYIDWRSIKIDAKPYKDKVFTLHDLKDIFIDNTIPISKSQTKDITILNSSSYYRFLKNDILNAKNSIFMISPFVSENRWGKLRDIFQIFKSKKPDAKIEIITRPPDKMYNNELNMSAVKVLNELIDFGAIVKVNKKIHSKLVVLDLGTKYAISYWGSLNPLSFKNTTEINTRLEGKEIAEQLIEISLAGKFYPYQKIEFINDNYIVDLETSVLKQLKDFRWTLAGYYGRQPGWICSNETLDKIVEYVPIKENEFKMIPQFTRRNFVLWNHILEIEEIISPLYGHKNGARSGQTNLFN
jgi:hypothetical protein